MVIGVTGKIGSGKDTVTQMIINILSSRNLSYKNMKFAYELKCFVARVLGVSLEKLESHEFKNSTLPPEWDYTTTKLLETYGTPIIHSKHMTVRELLIRIGDGMRRVVHPDIWVNALFINYKPKDIQDEFTYPNWVVSDVRYPNEKSRIEEEGFLIRVNRSGISELDHISETALDNEKFKYVIQNNGTLSDLLESVKDILAKEKLL